MACVITLTIDMIWRKVPHPSQHVLPAGRQVTLELTKALGRRPSHSGTQPSVLSQPRLDPGTPSAGSQACLRADVVQQVLDVQPDEGVVVDGPPASAARLSRGFSLFCCPCIAALGRPGPWAALGPGPPWAGQATSAPLRLQVELRPAPCLQTFEAFECSACPEAPLSKQWPKLSIN